MQHPFLDESFEIRWSQLTPDRVEPDIRKALADAAAAVDAVAAQDPAGATFDSAFMALEAATAPLTRAWGLVSHLDSVMNSKELRAAHNQMLPEVSAFYARIPLNEKLWQVLKAAAANTDASALSPVRKRFMDETLADFRESGADLPPAQKARLEAIEQELSAKTQKYTENTLDSTNAFQLVIENEAELAGLPESAKEAAREDARAKGIGSDSEPKWRFTLHAPSMLPVMRYLDSDAHRKTMHRGFTSVASDGEYDNTALISEILELRAEKAQLLGKEHFADHILQRRMAKNGANALGFVEDLHAKTKRAFDRENAELEQFKAERTGTPRAPLAPWEAGYWSEKMRRELYDLDEEELRPYFPIGNVIEGLFTICQRLFGIRITERTGSAKPEVWHEDVNFYDIHDEASGEHIGSFYTDWYPRESKRSGAWMNYLITGDRSGSKRSPHLGLMCGNLNKPVAGKPALLTHREVETVFHETGHLLHHLLGDVEIKSLNGVNVAWDFVELPSQIMENWCWDRESLDLFARHYQTGATIPEDLYQRMLAARNFQAANFQMRQLSFGKMDLELHIRHRSILGDDLDASIEQLLAEYLPPRSEPSRSNLRQFGHLFSSPTGYAAGYYSYKWAEVLDADAFTRFRKEGILNPATGRAFRAHILSRGNSEDPAKLFRDFMGRDPDPNALLERLGLN